MELIIPNQRLEEALKVVAKLIKVSEKMGRFISFNVEDTNPLIVERTVASSMVGGGLTISKVSIPRSRITLDISDENGSHSILEYDNARFVARIDIAPNGETLVHPAPDYDKDIPEQYYRALEHKCDHCHHQRYRVKYYLVEKDGELLQVGSSCVKEFIGINPAWVLSTFENLEKLKRYSEVSSGGGSYNYQYDVNEVATIAAGVIGVDDAYLKGETWHRVSVLMNNPDTIVEKHFREQCIEMHRFYNENDIDSYMSDFSFSDFATFVENMQSSNYVNNLKTIVRNKWMNDNKSFATLVSGVYLYIKDKHGLNKKQADKPLRETLNEWADEYKVKDRVDFNDVLVTRHHVIDGYYGETHLYSMLDEKGRNLIWFASRKVEQLNEAMENKSSVNLIGTIKKFSTNEYKGTEQYQTVLTRVKVYN